LTFALLLFGTSVARLCIILAGMANYKDLIVFRKADELAFQIYKATEAFPKAEMFGLTSQIRRAALSVPTNIVEGYARKSKKELAQFVNIALGSHAETEYLFSFSRKLGYYKSDTSQVENLLAEVGRLLWSFSRSL
jgi:four helix bundle protein